MKKRILPTRLASPAYPRLTAALVGAGLLASCGRSDLYLEDEAPPPAASAPDASTDRPLPLPLALAADAGSGPDAARPGPDAARPGPDAASPGPDAGQPGPDASEFLGGGAPDPDPDQ